MLHNKLMPYNFDKPIEIRDARNGEWFWVEKSVWANTLLTSSDKVLYGTLAYFANGKTQEAYPSLKKLAHQSALSERQVALSIKKLEEHKYISIKRRSGKPNYYTLLKTRYANFAEVQNSSTTYAKNGVGGMQNSSTNNNYINKNYINKKKEIYKEKRYLDNKDFHEQLRAMFPNIPIEEEIERMKDWLAANGRQKKDYAAFARNWLRQSISQEKGKIYEI